MDSFNLLLIVLLGSSLLLLLNLLKQQREMKRLTQIETEKVSVKKKGKQKFRMQLTYFKTLRKKTNMYYQFKKKKEMANYLYYGILIFEGVLFVGFLMWNKPIFAIAFPLTVHVTAVKGLDLLSLSVHYYIQKELPNAIKHLIKVMSKTSDLKTIMYETSKNLNEPLRGMFFDMSRRMLTENHEKVLMEVAEELDDIWFYAFAFLMVSYKEQSKKSDIITNLTTLADMLDKEMYVKEKAITDKKFVVIMNYAVALIAVAIFLLNVFINEHAVPFFFGSLGGMIAFLAGIWAIVGTILINLVMSHKAD
jgi:hypothetical protein